MQFSNKLVAIRHAVEDNNTSHSQEPGASSNPPDPHKHFPLCSFMVEGIHGSFEPMCLLLLN
eukprot:1160673-Pelagomonas_calceolata.AAC.1